MDSYQKLRDMGFYSLAAFYKVKKMYEDNTDCQLNPAQSHLLTYGTIGYLRSEDIDMALTTEEQLPHWLNSYLMCLNVWAKRNLKNPASWRFASSWQYNKKLIDSPYRFRARIWFNHIAKMNPGSEVGKRADKVVQLIDRRNDMQ